MNKNKKKTSSTVSTKKNARRNQMWYRNGKRRTIRRKSSGNKKYRATRKMRGRFSMKGGRVLGQGSYGLVIGDPRLKCKDETEDNSDLKTQVSKLFTSEYDANKEYGVLARLNIFFNSDLTELEKYAVLPLKKCTVDPIDLKKELNANLKDAPLISQHYESGGNLQVTYPKGDRDLFDVIIYGDIEDLEEFVKKTQNILKGLQLLHDKGFSHGDIKLKNCVVVSTDVKGTDVKDTNFKIIDMADVEHIE